MRLILTLSAIVSAMVFIGCVSETPVGGTQSAHTLTATTQRTITYNYLLYWPKSEEGPEATRRWPLVIFLHGSGERGTDVSKVAAHGPPKQAKEGKQFPFMLVSPQCPENQWWEVDSMQAMLDQLLARYGNHIDRDRIYITGLSMGGGGAWEWISRPKNPFAAAAIVCGATRYLPTRIKDPVPVWAFHGEDDDVVPPWFATTMIDLFKQAGGETRITMYPGVNHGSWYKAYDEPELWEWLLSHTKKPATEGRGVFVVPHAATTQSIQPDW